MNPDATDQRVPAARPATNRAPAVAAGPDAGRFEAAVRDEARHGSRQRYVFQPIVDLERAVVVGHEMLSRFDGPPHAGPDRWFAVADRIGVGPSLHGRVVRHGLEQLATLPRDTFLTVNLNPNVVIAPEVAALLDDATSLSPLVIELTEQKVSADPTAMLALLARARRNGAMIAIDDAGAGYAGLQALLAVRPQLVKLDRSLVHTVDRDPARAALVEVLGEFVGRLDGWVLAEGIETLAELRACVDLGVPLGQGYVLGRPSADFTTELDPDVRRAIVHRAQARTFHETLAPLLQTAPIAESVEGAEALLSSDATLEHIVIVDADTRPVSLLSRTVAGRSFGPRADLLLARMSEPAADVARRAATRDAAVRFDPVVCRDGRGRYQGIVTVDQLLRRLADVPRAS